MKNSNKKHTKLLATCCLIGCLCLLIHSKSENIDNNIVNAPDKFKTVFEDKCVKCHGGKKTKGDLDIVKMLEKGIHADDIDAWSKILSEIQSGNMPPEDEENHLSSDETKKITDQIHQTLGNTGNTSTHRMITPDEYKNSIADIFQVDYKNFDPIGDLYPYVNHDHNFYTINSNEMMNVFYYNTIKLGIMPIIKSYNATNTPLLSRQMSKKRTSDQNTSKKKKVVKTLTQEELKQKIQEDRAKRFSTYVKKGMNRKAIAQREAFVLKNKYAAKNPHSNNHSYHIKFPMKMAPLAGDCIDGYFEFAKNYWGIRAKSWRDNRNDPISLLGGAKLQFISLPPGKYRLTIRASGHDRQTITSIPSKFIPEELWNNGGRLEHEKCKLTVYKTATKKTTNKKETGLQYTPVGSFFIEDNKVQDYSVEINSHWNVSLGIQFENGIVNLKKAGEDVEFEEVPDITFDENENVIGYVKAKKTLPTVRIYDMTVEKIGDVKMGNLYITDMANFNDKQAKAKIARFIKEMYLNGLEKFMSFYDSLRQSEKSPHEAFCNTIGSILITANFLYIDEQSNEFDQILRHASYSLTKTIPDETFKSNFKKFRTNEITAKQFTESIVQSKNFNYFVKSFANQWLNLLEINSNPPDRTKYPMFYEYELKEQFLNETYSYITYLFEENRNISELVDSDYAFLNDTLARFYGINNINNTAIKKVDLKSINKIGILNHASFMASTSNGVDDLPFRRSKWISENILDKIIPPPPDNIDVSGFVKGENSGEDFKSRIKSHMISTQCLDCHKLIDDIAINIHPFDTLGHVKHEEFTHKEASEALQSLQDNVTSSHRRIASAFTKKLLSFTTGRKMNITDLMLVNTILDEVKKDGYKARDILERIIFHIF